MARPGLITCPVPWGKSIKGVAEVSSNMLEGKVVLVTGAGNGIGAEIAKLAAKEGAKVVVNDLGSSQFGVGADASPAQKVVDEIRAAGGEAAPSFHSVATWESAHAIVDDAVKAFGRLNVVVNNAGVLRDTMFHKMTDEDWQTVIGVTLSGYFYVSRAAANLFKNQNSGCYVHMSSNVGTDRQLRPGELRGGQNGCRRALQVHRARSFPLQGPLELHCTIRLYAHDRQHPHRHRGKSTARGRTAADDGSQDRTFHGRADER